MKRLRIMLILAILFVGFFPDPADLFDDSLGEACPHYDSLFVTIYGGWQYCAATPGKWVFILIPGHILTKDVPHTISPTIAIPWPFDGYLWSSQ